MYVANIIFIKSEWHTKYKWAGFICLATLSGASYYGQELIIPINDYIHAGKVTSEAELSSLLQEWMEYNDARWYIMNVRWLAMMYFFISKRNA